jgi:Caspase domain
MASHLAIAIGVSDYISMEPLPYAKRDAHAVQKFLTKDAKFKQLFYFADDSPNATLNEGITISTQPTFDNLKRFFQMRFAVPFLEPDDTLWFFFSGHGLNYGSRDYLLPSDADPEQADLTAIAIDDIVDCLKRSGTHNIVLLLDACHSEKQQFGQGFGTDPEGVITLFSANYNQISSQVSPLGKGTFTHALIEGWAALADFRNATLDHLYLYLSDRLPKLTRQYNLPAQTPRLQVEPPLAIAAIPLPHAKVRQGLLQRLFLHRQIKSALKGATPLSPIRAISLSNLVMGSVGVAVLFGGIGSTFYQGSNATKPASTKVAKVYPQPKKQTTRDQINPLTAQSNPAEANLDQNGLMRPPKVGRYYAEDPKFSASRREIAKKGTRFCIRKVDGAPAPAVNKQTTISSLSLRRDGYYVDATQEKIRLGAVYTEFADSNTTWQRLETDVDESGLMGDCLTSSRQYMRQAKAE